MAKPGGRGRSTQEQSKGRGGQEEALARVLDRLGKSKAMRPGDIVFHLSGAGGGSFVVECSDSGARVTEAVASGRDYPPLVEVIGDATRIRAVLIGTKDAREEFLGGHFRVRGDLRYLSNVALELGIIKQPL